MPKIEISEELYKELLSKISNFGETAESVLRREMNMNKKDTTLSKSNPNHIQENKTTYSNAGKKKITLKEIKELYIRARRVFESFENGIYEGRKELEIALNYLETEVGMNRGSAHIYIKVFLTLKKGSLHRNKMSINDVAAEYFLKQILADDGKKGLDVALKSLWLYIKYREELTKSTMIVFRKLHTEFSAML